MAVSALSPASWWGFFDDCSGPENIGILFAARVTRVLVSAAIRGILCHSISGVGSGLPSGRLATLVRNYEQTVRWNCEQMLYLRCSRLVRMAADVRIELD